MKARLVCALFVLSASGAAQPVREVSTQAVSPLRIPMFRHGYVVMLQPDAAAPAFGFVAYSRDGNFAFEKSIKLSGDSRPSVMDVDFDSDGEIAVSASGLGASGLPDKQDYRIVRHFSQEGNLLQASLPRSSFPPGLEPGMMGGPQIQVAGARVGVLAYAGTTSEHHEWVELDLDGNLLVRSRIDSVIQAPTLAAFTDDDHVYLQGRGLGELHTFDRASQTWRSVPSQGTMLIGGDGAELVYYRSGRGQPVRLQWFNQP